MTEGCRIFINAVKVALGGFAHCVAVTRAHRVNEYEIRLVEQAFAVVYELIRRRRREFAVYRPGAARAESAHVQPHRSRTGSAIVQKRNRARAWVFHVTARI